MSAPEQPDTGSPYGEGGGTGLLAAVAWGVSAVSALRDYAAAVMAEAQALVAAEAAAREEALSDLAPGPHADDAAAAAAEIPLGGLYSDAAGAVRKRIA